MNFDFKTIDKKYRVVSFWSWNEMRSVPETLWRENAAEELVITVTCDGPVRIRVIWAGGEKVIG